MQNDVPRLLIAGNEHTDWISYSIDSDLLTPADGWQVELGIPPQSIPSYIKPWALCELYLGSTLVMTGRVDSFTRSIAKGQHTLSLSGRDNAAVLLDCSAPIFVQRQMTLPEVVDAIVKPLGVSKVKIQGAESFEKVTVEPGMRAWDALQEAAEISKLWPWCEPDGTLIVGKPTEGSGAVAFLQVDYEGKTTNVLDLQVTEDISGYYSEVTCLGQSNGTEYVDSDHTIKAQATDNTYGAYRPLIQNEGYSEKEEKAENIAKKLLNDGLFGAFEVVVKVRGHSFDGTLWQPGQRVGVTSAPHGVDDTYFLYKRIFTRSISGVFTTLHLRKDGIWLAD